MNQIIQLEVKITTIEGMGKTFKDSPEKYRRQLEDRRRKKGKKEKKSGTDSGGDTSPWDPWANVPTEN